MSFARGVLKGFLSQGLEQKAASDALLGDITKQTAVNLLNEKIPNFNKQLQSGKSENRNGSAKVARPKENDFIYFLWF